MNLIVLIANGLALLQLASGQGSRTAWSAQSAGAGLDGVPVSFRADSGNIPGTRETVNALKIDTNVLRLVREGVLAPLSNLTFHMSLYERSSKVAQPTVSSKETLGKTPLKNPGLPPLSGLRLLGAQPGNNVQFGRMSLSEVQINQVDKRMNENYGSFPPLTQNTIRNDMAFGADKTSKIHKDMNKIGRTTVKTVDSFGNSKKARITSNEGRTDIISQAMQEVQNILHMRNSNSHDSIKNSKSLSTSSSTGSSMIEDTGSKVDFGYIDFQISNPSSDIRQTIIDINATESASPVNNTRSAQEEIHGLNDVIINHTPTQSGESSTFNQLGMLEQVLLGGHPDFSQLELALQEPITQKHENLSHGVDFLKVRNVSTETINKPRPFQEGHVRDNLKDNFLEFGLVSTGSKINDNVLTLRNPSSDAVYVSNKPSSNDTKTTIADARNTNLDEEIINRVADNLLAQLRKRFKQYVQTMQSGSDSHIDNTYNLTDHNILLGSDQERTYSKQLIGHNSKSTVQRKQPSSTELNNNFSDKQIYSTLNRTQLPNVTNEDAHQNTQKSQNSVNPNFTITAGKVSSSITNKSQTNLPGLDMQDPLEEQFYDLTEQSLVNQPLYKNPNLINFHGQKSMLSSNSIYQLPNLLNEYRLERNERNKTENVSTFYQNQLNTLNKNKNFTNETLSKMQDIINNYESQMVNLTHEIPMTNDSITTMQTPANYFESEFLSLPENSLLNQPLYKNPNLKIYSKVQTGNSSEPHIDVFIKYIREQLTNKPDTVLHPANDPDMSRATAINSDAYQPSIQEEMDTTATIYTEPIPFISDKSPLPPRYGSADTLINHSAYNPDLLGSTSKAAVLSQRNISNDLTISDRLNLPYSASKESVNSGNSIFLEKATAKTKLQEKSKTRYDGTNQTFSDIPISTDPNAQQNLLKMQMEMTQDRMLLQQTLSALLSTMNNLQTFIIESKKNEVPNAPSFIERKQTTTTTTSAPITTSTVTTITPVPTTTTTTAKTTTIPTTTTATLTLSKSSALLEALNAMKSELNLGQVSTPTQGSTYQDTTTLFQPSLTSLTNELTNTTGPTDGTAMAEGAEPLDSWSSALDFVRKYVEDISHSKPSTPAPTASGQPLTSDQKLNQLQTLLEGISPGQLQSLVEVIKKRANGGSGSRSDTQQSPVPTSRQEPPPRDIPRDFPRDMPRDFPRDMPRDVPRDFPRDMPRDMPRDFPRDMPRDLPRDFPRDMSRDMPRDFPRDMQRDMPRDFPRDMPRDRSPFSRGPPGYIPPPPGSENRGAPPREFIRGSPNEMMGPGGPGDMPPWARNGPPMGGPQGGMGGPPQGGSLDLNSPQVARLIRVISKGIPQMLAGRTGGARNPVTGEQPEQAEGGGMNPMMMAMLMNGGGGGLGGLLGGGGGSGGNPLADLLGGGGGGLASLLGGGSGGSPDIASMLGGGGGGMAGLARLLSGASGSSGEGAGGLASLLGGGGSGGGAAGLAALLGGGGGGGSSSSGEGGGMMNPAMLAALMGGGGLMGGSGEGAAGDPTAVANAILLAMQEEVANYTSSVKNVTKTTAAPSSENLKGQSVAVGQRYRWLMEKIRNGSLDGIPPAAKAVSLAAIASGDPRRAGSGRGNGQSRNAQDPPPPIDVGPAQTDIKELQRRLGLQQQLDQRRQQQTQQQEQQRLVRQKQLQREQQKLQVQRQQQGQVPEGVPINLGTSVPNNGARGSQQQRGRGNNGGRNNQNQQPQGGGGGGNGGGGGGNGGGGGFNDLFGGGAGGLGALLGGGMGGGGDMNMMHLLMGGGGGGGDMAGLAAMMGGGGAGGMNLASLFGGGEGGMGGMGGMAGLLGGGGAGGGDLASLLGGGGAGSSGSFDFGSLLGGGAGPFGGGGGGNADLAALLGGGGGGGGAGGAPDFASMMAGSGGLGGGAGGDIASLFGGAGALGGGTPDLTSLLSGGGMGGSAGSGGMPDPLARPGGRRATPPRQGGLATGGLGAGPAGMGAGLGAAANLLNPMGPGRPFIPGMTGNQVRDLMNGRPGPVPMDIALEAQMLHQLGQTPDQIADTLGDKLQLRWSMNPMAQAAHTQVNSAMMSGVAGGGGPTGFMG